jgi:hypothetical protein
LLKYSAGEQSNVEAQTDAVSVDHTEHLYRSEHAADYDALVEALEHCLETPSAPLPPEFLNLRIPEMAIALNQLHLSDAAEGDAQGSP